MDDNKTIYCLFEKPLVIFRYFALPGEDIVKKRIAFLPI